MGDRHLKIYEPRDNLVMAGRVAMSAAWVLRDHDDEHWMSCTMG